MNEKAKLQFGDLFAGAGGLSLGFILAGHPIINYRPLFAIDNDYQALESYQGSMSWLFQNAPEILHYVPPTFRRNIEDLNTKALFRLFKLKAKDLDLLVGGPPCQGYSTSNRKSSKSSKDERNRLSKFFFDVLEEIYPKMFLVENVQGVKWTGATPEMGSYPVQTPLLPELNETISNVQHFMIERARSIGYVTWYGVLNSVDFGVPQTRHRFFLFGVRSDIVTEPSKTTLDSYLKALQVTKQVTVDEAIADLPEIKNGQNWEGNHYKPSENSFVQLMRRFMPNGELRDHFTTKHADYVIDRYKKIPEGGNWQDIKELMTNYAKIDNTHSNIYRRLKKDKPAITISHYRKSMIVHPTQDRGISFREACRLQSFPDWYRFSGPVNDRQQQLANAVPPLLASKIAYAIAECWLNIK